MQIFSNVRVRCQHVKTTSQKNSPFFNVSVSCFFIYNIPLIIQLVLTIWLALTISHCSHIQHFQIRLLNFYRKLTFTLLVSLNHFYQFFTFTWQASFLLAHAFTLDINLPFFQSLIPPNSLYECLFIFISPILNYNLDLYIYYSLVSRVHFHVVILHFHPGLFYFLFYFLFLSAWCINVYKRET